MREEEMVAAGSAGPSYSTRLCAEASHRAAQKCPARVQCRRPAAAAPNMLREKPNGSRPGAPSCERRSQEQRRPWCIECGRPMGATRQGRIQIACACEPRWIESSTNPSHTPMRGPALLSAPLRTAISILLRQGDRKHPRASRKSWVLCNAFAATEAVAIE